MNDKVFIVIPAYNEASSIGNVLDTLLNSGYKNIIVVDDGSKDQTAKITEEKDVTVVRHVINRGLGGALGTGISAALMKKADVIVTFDADGQHDAAEIKTLIDPIKKNEADVVIGSRLLNPKGMPFLRRIFNIAGNVVTYLLFGIYVTDSQSGLRAFSYHAASKILIKTNRMEVSSEIIREIKENNLRFKEVPIKPIYTTYSLSKGQNFFVGVKTFLKLVIHKLIV